MRRLKAWLRTPALERVLFLPDTHCPYHDRKAYDLVERVAKRIRFNRCVIGGDFADFYAVSSHVKDPSRGGIIRGVIIMRRSLFDAIRLILEKSDRLSCDDLGFIQCLHVSFVENLRIEYEAYCRKHGIRPTTPKESVSIR